MIRVSKKLKAALKLHEQPAYKIAHRAGINPNTLSKLIHGIDRIRPADPRVIAVGKVLGVQASDCFEVGEYNPELGTAANANE